MGRYKYVWPYAYGQAHGQFGDVTIGLLCGDVTIGLLCGDVTIGLLGGDCQETHPPREKFEVDQLVSYGGWSGQLLQLACQVFLFVVNVLIWILGCVLLAAGIIAELQKEDYGDVSSSVLASPAIICIIIGSILFLLGILGSVGALVELYYVLMIYVLLLGIILLVEIGIAAFIFIRSDKTEDIVRENMEELIIKYRDDPDLQNLIDSIQSDLLECCGVDGPNDWELNPYFNCSSPSLQSCSVPFSCCLPGNSSVVNTQCGDDVLLPQNSGTRDQLIYTEGCYDQFEDVIRNLLPVLSGVLIGIIAMEFMSIFLAIGLIVDIRQERKASKQWYEFHPKQKRKRSEVGNFALTPRSKY